MPKLKPNLIIAFCKIKILLVQWLWFILMNYYEDKYFFKIILYTKNTIIFKFNKKYKKNPKLSICYTKV